jgi:hypothetical protein
MDQIRYSRMRCWLEEGLKNSFFTSLLKSWKSLINQQIALIQTQSSDWERELTEIVQHFAYRGSSHRRKDAVLDIHLIDMVWLHRSTIPCSQGRRGRSFTWYYDFYLPSRRLEEQKACGQITMRDLNFSVFTQFFKVLFFLLLFS